MATVSLKRKIGHRVLNGHPWIFGNEIQEIKGDFLPGDTVVVETHDGKFLGKGYINPQSQIVVRLLTRKKNDEIDEAFFLNRIMLAWEYRQKIGYKENCRLIFGEADEMPQLIIDKFNDHFVIQTLALGIDKWKPAIVKALEKVFSPKGIYERNDVPVRELEGLDQPLLLQFGEFPLSRQHRRLAQLREGALVVVEALNPADVGAAHAGKSSADWRGEN